MFTNPEYKMVLKRKYRRVLKGERVIILKRQGYKCSHCGELLLEGEYDMDHIIALADGGGDEMGNRQAICLRGHRLKTLNDAMNRALRRRQENADRSINSL
jgi:5-methylcytosine-specific restriction endonuclease McrA